MDEDTAFAFVLVVCLLFVLVSHFRTSVQLSAIEGAVNRSGFDVSPCRGCGEAVVCLPDGMPFCEACGVEE